MIRVKNLFYQYPKNNQDTLKQINFDVKKGEIRCGLRVPQFLW